jgi:hypothetical protein
MTVRIAGAAAAAIIVAMAAPVRAADVDIVAVFGKAAAENRTGIGKKTKPVDGRPAKAGEIIVTIIKNEGVETKSKPAEAGDVVVRNRCPETGNEEYLVKANRVKDRYSEPKGAADKDGWQEYEPKGSDMKFFIVTAADGELAFQAPWGEAMKAVPGDTIVQDPGNPKDTYRIAAASWKCTYNVTKAP